MDMVQILERVIDEGIFNAKNTYTSSVLDVASNNQACLEGSVAGFEACSGKDASWLTGALARACRATFKAYNLDTGARGNNYWYCRCFENSVWFVCDVASVVLYMQGLTKISTISVRGALTAKQILMSDGCYVPLVGTEKEFLDFSA